MCECEWWSLDKINVSVKQRLRDSFPFRGPLREEQLRKRIESGSLFGYVMCDLHVPEHLKKQFANILPLFKTINVCRQNLGHLM